MVAHSVLGLNHGSYGGKPSTIELSQYHLSTHSRITKKLQIYYSGVRSLFKS